MTEREILDQELKAKNRLETIRYFFEQSNIPENYLNYSINDYMNFNRENQTERVRDSRRKAAKFTSDFCTDIRDKTNTISKKSVLIFGKSGSGKTVLGTMILRCYIEKSEKKVLYTQYSSFRNEIETTQFSEERRFVTEKYIEPYCLMIDEITEKQSNPKITNRLEEILKVRTAKGKITILTTDMSLMDIKRCFDKVVYGHITNPNYFNEKVEIEVEEKIESMINEGVEYLFDKNSEFDVQLLNKKTGKIGKKTISATALFFILKDAHIKKTTKNIGDIND